MKGKFQITYDEGLTPHVSFDGQELTGVAEVRFAQAAGDRLPQVFVRFAATSIEVDGITAEIVGETDRPTPAEWLASINVDRLAKKAVERAGWDQDPMAAFIEELKAAAK